MDEWDPKYDLRDADFERDFGVDLRDTSERMLLDNYLVVVYPKKKLSSELRTVLQTAGAAAIKPIDKPAHLADIPAETKPLLFLVEREADLDARAKTALNAVARRWPATAMALTHKRLFVWLLRKQASTTDPLYGVMWRSDQPQKLTAQLTPPA